MKAAEASAEQQPLLGSSGLKQTSRNRAVRRRESQLLVLTGFLIFVFALALLFAALSKLKYKIKPVTPPIQLPHSVKHFWAQYTPYYSTSSYRAPPHHCRITQVNIVSLHDASHFNYLYYYLLFSCNGMEHGFQLLARMKDKTSRLLSRG